MIRYFTPCTEGLVTVCQTYNFTLPRPLKQVVPNFQLVCLYRLSSVGLYVKGRSGSQEVRLIRVDGFLNLLKKGPVNCFVHGCPFI